MKFADAIQDFGVHLGAERNVSPHTRRAYLSDVRQFAAASGGERDPAAVTATEVRAFLAEMHTARHPSTLGRKLASLRCFFRYLQREGVCALDPTAGIPAPRKPKTLPNPLPVDDCATLIEAADLAPRKKGSERSRLRDRALVELLYGAGLRVGEASALDVRDVDLHRGDVRVLGKGGKEQVRLLRPALHESRRRGPGSLHGKLARRESDI